MSGRAAPTRIFPRPWLALLLGCVAVVVAGETFLLNLTLPFLTTGFNSGRVDSPFTLFVYVSTSAALDLALLLAIWLLIVPAARRLGATRLQVFGAAGLAAIGVPLGLTALRSSLHAVVGTMFSLMLLRQFSQVDSSGLVEAEIGRASCRERV